MSNLTGKPNLHPSLTKGIELDLVTAQHQQSPMREHEMTHLEPVELQLPGLTLSAPFYG